MIAAQYLFKGTVGARQSGPHRDKRLRHAARCRYDFIDLRFGKVAQLQRHQIALSHQVERLLTAKSLVEAQVDHAGASRKLFDLIRQTCSGNNDLEAVRPLTSSSTQELEKLPIYAC
ncbi:hypothetical protein AJ88_15735 [Mesorhizobium amorphae CCBAU 01583]|nr:hypothetical protein AJ88_15735 [Mesorhizobium amorphae CCBAU 01583]